MISEILLEAFARSYEPPAWIIDGLLRDGVLPIRGAIQIALDGVTQAQLESLDHDSHALAENMFPGDSETRGRLLVVSQAAYEMVQARRLALAAQGANSPPYGHASLHGIVPDAEGLVPLAAFEIDGDSLCRNGTAFFVLPGVAAANANYWLLSELQRYELVDSVKVRLDPLLFGPIAELHGGFYRAAIYGKALDWNRIDALCEVDHGRWMPGRLSRGYLFTDYAWIPHDHEVDFLCEELPIDSEVARRGTRYLHAIYDKDRHLITHLDGATRILTPAEHAQRSTQHVRNAGKIGSRVKLFRTDKPIRSDVLSALAESFFFWNYDVARYFGAPIHPDL